MITSLLGNGFTNSTASVSLFLVKTVMFYTYMFRKAINSLFEFPFFSSQLINLRDVLYIYHLATMAYCCIGSSTRFIIFYIHQNYSDPQ